ncbi:uncharacterized protein [Miscanthus floridulus]|uniref:uncharacterized protein n=1 Tax=Miscanthus floridulus TaxID=154761 RepID=UPI003457863A
MQIAAAAKVEEERRKRRRKEGAPPPPPGTCTGTGRRHRSHSRRPCRAPRSLREGAPRRPTALNAAITAERKEEEEPRNRRPWPTAAASARVLGRSPLQIRRRTGPEPPPPWVSPSARPGAACPSATRIRPWDRWIRTPGQGGRPGPPQPPPAAHSGLAAPEYATRKPIPDRRSYHREGEPRCRPPSKPCGHANGLLRLRRGGGGERRMQRPSADSREHANVRVANHAADKQRKKVKDDEENKLWSKQRVKLQRGKRRQGSSEEEEEEEEEEEDGSMLPILWDDLVTGDEDPPSPQARPFLRHATGQEGKDMALAPVESKCPTPSGPSMAASEPAKSGHLALSRPSMVAPESAKIGHPALSEPLVVPPKSTGGGRSDSSEPSEPREGSKRQCANDELPGSGKRAPKCPHMMVSG